MKRTMSLAIIALGLCGLDLAAQEKTVQEEALQKVVADLQGLIKAADTDGNGTLNRVEFAAFHPSVRKAAEKLENQLDPSIAAKKSAKDLKKYDKNADTKLDDEEKKAMDEAIRLKEIKDFDWDEDGQLNEREKTALKWAEEGKMDGRFRKYDLDKNGELSKDEINAAITAISGLKIKKV